MQNEWAPLWCGGSCVASIVPDPSRETKAKSCLCPSLGRRGIVSPPEANTTMPLHCCVGPVLSLTRVQVRRDRDPTRLQECGLVVMTHHAPFPGNRCEMQCNGTTSAHERTTNEASGGLGWQLPRSIIHDCRSLQALSIPPIGAKCQWV